MKKKTAALNVVLEPIRASAKLEAVIVTDSTGKVLASVYSAAETGRVDAESLDTLWALAQRVIGGGELEALKHLKEAIYYTYDGRQVVCHPFTVKERDYLLALMVPPHKTHKQAAAKLVKALRGALA